LIRSCNSDVADWYGILSHVKGVPFRGSENSAERLFELVEHSA